LPTDFILFYYFIILLLFNKYFGVGCNGPFFIGPFEEKAETLKAPQN